MTKLKKPLSVETISLRYSTVTDASVIPLFRLCTNVKKVLLSETLISDQSLLTLFENCPNVTKLDCDGCPYITDESISNLPYRKLVYLNLNNCEITNVSIRNLAKICRKLSYFGIANCGTVTSKCLGSLLKQNPEIKHLFLYGCEGLNVLIVNIIIENCPQLMSININECPKLIDHYRQIERHINLVEKKL